MPEAYPETARERNAWIVTRRGQRHRLDPRRPYLVLSEEEPDEAGLAVPVRTVFLTNRECPFRCLMCDLWRNTLEKPTPAGAIHEQVRFACDRIPDARWTKLYNAGSYFDPLAIPPDEDLGVLDLLRGQERLIVESHPGFVRERCRRFVVAAGAHGATLEVAMGLETVHAKVLERLNKRMTLAGFAAAVERLHTWGARIRAFILVRPPWMTDAEGLEWACRSLDFAFSLGVHACSLIPVRDTDGAMQHLGENGEFHRPSLGAVEQAMAYGLGLGAGRVFADTWEMEQFATCTGCGSSRVRRLAEANLRQILPARSMCEECGT